MEELLSSSTEFTWGLTLLGRQKCIDLSLVLLRLKFLLKNWKGINIQFMI